MIATFFHIFFLWMITTLATNKKILTETRTTQTHEMLAAPLSLPHTRPPPNDHFIHACKGARTTLWPRNCQKASWPRNLLIWNHSRTSCSANDIKVRRSNYPNWTARRVVVCVVACLPCHIWVVHMWKMQSFFSASSDRTVCRPSPSYAKSCAASKLWFMYGPPFSQSAISDRLHPYWFFFFKKARMLAIVQCRPPLGGFVVLKYYDFNYKASNPPTHSHSEPSTHQCTLKDEWYVMRKQFSVGLQFPS
jgi:hypothetical protein